MYYRNICPACKSNKSQYIRKLGHLTIAKCCICGLLYANCFDLVQIEAHYANCPYPSEETFEQNVVVYEGLCDTLLRFRPKVADLLDIGSGTGGFLMAYHRRDPSAVLYAIERDEHLSHQLKSKLPSVTFVAEDLTTLSSVNQHFEVITLHQVLEHTFEPLALLRAVYEKLKDGGFVFLTVPNRWSIMPLLGGTDWCFALPDHLQFFSKETLFRLLQHSGFRNPKRIIEWGGSTTQLLPSKVLQFVTRWLCISSELRVIAQK